MGFANNTLRALMSTTSVLSPLLVLSMAALLIPRANAKENPVTAIALFDGPSGPAYVQITGMMLNGKSEMRVCDGMDRMNKAAYDNLLRTQLAGGTSLQRGADGVLTLTVNSKPMCVVPSNLKFEKNAQLTPADAADQALLQGTIISASTPGSDLPQFRRGVELVFVSAPDDDLAHYLVAQRANSIAGWQEFLERNGSSAHTADAKKALAAIHQEAAESAFARYQTSADIAFLKQAQQHAVQSGKVVAGYPQAFKLRTRINKELDSLLESDRAKLQAYRHALSEQTPGYAGLATARKHSGELLAVNAEYAPVLNLHAEILSEVRKLDSAVANAEALAVAKDYDRALDALGPYHAFSGEEARIGAIVTAAYIVHFHRGQDFAGQQDWEKAVPELHRAAEIKSDSQEAAAALKNAESQLAVTRNREAAQRALAASKDYAANKEFIEAYDVLAELPDAPRVLVTDQMIALKKDYVLAALRRAQKLQEIHFPIRGRADEEAAREAYALLNRASTLSPDPAIRLKLDLLSDKIGAYYMEQARRYLDKPLGSGVGLGWLYLGEADHYKPNQNTVKDAMALYAPAYQLRARLSIGVVLRDQTSRRDSLGFADQLADAIATGLESSGLSIKVVRQPKESPDAVQPNFVLVGEILEHRVVKDVNLETLPSKYRAGTHEAKNEVWTQANRDSLAAQQQLSSAQSALADAQAQHKKRDIIAAASDGVAAAQKQVDAAKNRLDATPQTQVQSVVAPYNYNKKNFDLTAAIQLAFRINDSAGNPVEPVVTIPKNNHKAVVVLENVKPEDTEGIKNQGTEPDEMQFLADLEIQARDALVRAVSDKAVVLPGRILQEARKRAAAGDADGAAEEYILYLNATPDSGSLERQEAAQFLREHFNVAVAGTQQLAATK
jgi:hypothetical protein